MNNQAARERIREFDRRHPRPKPVTSFISLNLKPQAKITIEVQGQTIFSGSAGDCDIMTTSRTFIESIEYTGIDHKGILIKAFKD